MGQAGRGVWCPTHTSVSRMTPGAQLHAGRWEGSMVAPCVSSGPQPPGRGPLATGLPSGRRAKLHPLLPTLHSCPSCPCPSLEKPSSVRQSLWLKTLRAADLEEALGPWKGWCCLSTCRGGEGRRRRCSGPAIHVFPPQGAPPWLCLLGARLPPRACVPGGAPPRTPWPGSRPGGADAGAGIEPLSWEVLVLVVCVNVRRCGS